METDKINTLHTQIFFIYIKKIWIEWFLKSEIFAQHRLNFAVLLFDEIEH